MTTKDTKPAETPATPPSLAAKLAAVMAAVGHVPKRGRNDFHKYDYATEADIADAIRVELSKRHIILLPAIKAQTREPVGEKGSVLTMLDMEFTFADGESGETITRAWAGAGTDKEDKGLYKAMTGGEKYFLLKTFLVPTGDDPEAADTKPATKSAARTTAPRQTPAAAASSTEPTRVSPWREVVITKVAEPAGDKKPYRITLTTNDGEKTLTTFSGALAALAQEAEADGVPVEARAEQKGNHLNLVELRRIERDDADPRDDLMPLDDDLEIPF